MVKKRKRKKKKRSFFDQRIFKDVIKRHSRTDYKELFETSSPEYFLSYIFLTPHFIRAMSIYWDNSYEDKVHKLALLYNYYHDDDLYEFFRVNHILNKDRPKDEYKKQLFALVSELWNDIPKDSSLNFVQLSESLKASPEYLYYFDLDMPPERINIARDFLVLGLSPMEVRKKHSLQHYSFIEAMKEVRQNELVPLSLDEPGLY